MYPFPASNCVLIYLTVCSTLYMGFFPASFTHKGTVVAFVCRAPVSSSPGGPAWFSCWWPFSPPSPLYSIWKNWLHWLPVLDLGSWPGSDQSIYSTLPSPWPKSFTDGQMTQTRPIRATWKKKPEPLTVRMENWAPKLRRACLCVRSAQKKTESRNGVLTLLELLDPAMSEAAICPKENCTFEWVGGIKTKSLNSLWWR